MSPVPRKISSSCGTCVQYYADNAHENCMDEDVEAVYRLDGENVEMLMQFD